MSRLATPSAIEYGTRPFLAILWSLFLAGFASFSSLYCVQPMMPVFADFFQISPTQSSFPGSVSKSMLLLNESIVDVKEG